MVRRYQTECPTYSKYNEIPCDAFESVTFDGKAKNFTYSTEKKKKTEEAQEPFLLKVSTASKDWCPVRIRVDMKESEGEVLFVRPTISLDGYAKYQYYVALFMDSASNQISRRVEAQKENYRMPKTWVGFDMMLMIERRMRLEEMIRKMDAMRYWFDDDSDDNMSDEMPVLPDDEIPVV